MSEENKDRTNSKEEETNEMNENKEQSEPKNEATDRSADETSAETRTEAGEMESETERLQKQLEESETAMNSYKDRFIRLAAEFENFRKRNETEKADFIKYSNEKIIKDLIPIIDDFQRALANGKKNTEFEAFYQGVEMIYQKLQKLLEEKGVEPIDSIGKEFDVMYHDVLMQVQRPEVSPHTIVEEVERGYTMHGKVIKHAKVIVAADNQAEAPGAGGSGPETSN